MLDKNELLKENLLDYFTYKKLVIMANIINKKEPCSLRIIEWFISTYCKKNTLKYMVRGKLFDVYYSYKNEQIKSYSKKYFDLFRRANKFTVKIKDVSIDTTVAQLNFFRWAIDNKIIEYMEHNHEKIKKEMNKDLVIKTKKIKFYDNVVITNNKITIRFE